MYECTSGVSNRKIQHYVKWFTEIVLGKEYIDKDTLGLWMLSHQNKKEICIKTELDCYHAEQMTIFDLAV